MTMTQVEKIMIAVVMMIMFVTTASMAAVIEVERLGSVEGPIWVSGIGPVNGFADGRTFINVPAGDVTIQAQKEQGGIETVSVKAVEGRITRVVMSAYSTTITKITSQQKQDIEPVNEPDSEPTVTPTVQPTPEPTKKPKDNNKDGDKKPKKNKP